MSSLLFPPADHSRLASLALGPGAAPARVLSGDPTATELVLHELAGTEIGLWEITPGVFRSTKSGISEFMYFLSGSGKITRENGEVIDIAADTFVTLPDGSEVVWDVTETARKIYVITETAPNPSI